MSVGRICLRDVDIAEGGESVLEVARRMRDRLVGTIVVVDGEGRPVGLVTDRDLTVRVLADGKDPRTTRVEAAMTREPKVVSEETPIEAALARMRAGAFRRLPVVNRDGKLVGILSLDDVLALLAEEFGQIGALLERETPHPAAG
jgi:CBS domain-containing protein